jgi:hypothetical protein
VVDLCLARDPAHAQTREQRVHRAILAVQALPSLAHQWRALVERGQRLEAAVMLGNDGFVAVLPRLQQRIDERRGDQGCVTGYCKNALRLRFVDRRKKAAERSTVGPAIHDDGTIEQRIERSGKRIASGNHHRSNVAQMMIDACEERLAFKRGLELSGEARGASAR